MVAIPCSANSRSRAVTTALISTIVRVTRSVSRRVASPPYAAARRARRGCRRRSRGSRTGPVRGVGEGDAGDQCAQQRALAALLAADDADVTAPPWTDRPSAGHGSARRGGRPRRWGRPVRLCPPSPREAGPAWKRLQSRHDLVQRGGPFQRGKPDLMGRWALVGQPLDQCGSARRAWPLWLSAEGMSAGWWP